MNRFNVLFGGFRNSPFFLLVCALITAFSAQLHAQTNCQYMMNFNLGSGTRTGMAANWNWIDDKWNLITESTNVVETYTYYGGSPTVTTKAYTTFTNLVWADNSNSTVTVTATNLFTVYANNLGMYGYTDTMFENYLGATELLVEDYDEFFNQILIYSDPQVLISNLPATNYDFYIYGLGEYSGEDEGFRITVGTNSPTAWKRTYHSGTLNTNWAENTQYVKFTNLTVNAGEDVVISMGATNYTGIHIINGFQLIVAGGGPTNAPAPTISPASGTYTNAISITMTNDRPDTSYYYKLNGSGWTLYSAPISRTEDTTIIAQARRHGNLDSATVTNTYTFPDNDGDGLTDAREYQLGTNPTLADTDYDGITDGQEVAAGTDPLSAASYTPVQLAYFRFNTNSWVGEAGQLPLTSTNLINPTSWDGKALLVNTNVAANLKYRDVETNLAANINCQRGTVRFWFKPDWGGTNAGGNGPGVAGRLIELGAYTNDATHGQWVVAFNTNGTEVLFSTQGDGVDTNHFTATISFSSNVWHQIVLTCTSTNSILYIDGQSVTNGPGVAHFPSLTVRANDGINIGSDRDGNQQAKGMFDELETYNYALDADTIYADYEFVAGRDTDGDGTTDIKEHENGTDWTVSDRPFTVQITSPKPGSILP